MRFTVSELRDYTCDISSADPPPADTKRSKHAQRRRRFPGADFETVARPSELAKWTLYETFVTVRK